MSATTYCALDVNAAKIGTLFCVVEVVMATGPIIKNETLTVDEGSGPNPTNLLDGDSPSSVQGSTLEVVNISGASGHASNPTAGTTVEGEYGEITFTGTNGQITYTPTITGLPQGETDTDVFDVSVQDSGTGDTQTVTFTVSVDGQNAPCFAANTLIHIIGIATAVEDLKIGDQVITTAGVSRPIRWLGHRTVDCRNHPRPHEVMPVRISAHAFGENRPSRDLFVSPGHAICVNVLGEVLIPAGLLVNGSTIRQIDVDAVTYWHVELESHDVILAENLPAESYLDMGNRDFFVESDLVALTAAPDADPSQRTHADFCRPFVVGGPILEAVRMLLRERAERFGWRSTDELDMHLVVDGQRLDPVVRDLTARFHVPADAKDVWLVSPTAQPRDTLGGTDTRDLGLYIGGLRVDDGFATRDVAIDDPLLCIGFHAVEDGARRWTSGRSRLPAALWESCEGDFYMRIDLAGRPVPRWTTVTAGAERLRLAIVA